MEKVGPIGWVTKITKQHTTVASSVHPLMSDIEDTPPKCRGTLQGQSSEARQ